MIINLPIDKALTVGGNILGCRLENDVLIIEYDRIMQMCPARFVYNATIEIFGWSKLVIRKFIPPQPEAEGHWETLDGFEPLGTMEVTSVSERRIALEGHCATDNRWMKYEIFDAKYRVICRRD